MALVMRQTELCNKIYQELVNTPFYEVEGGYQYAGYLLENTDKVCVTQQVRSGTYEFHQGTEHYRKAVREVAEGTFQKLMRLFISDEAYSMWITFQKEMDGIREYHQILEGLYETMMLIALEELFYKDGSSDMPSRQDTLTWETETKPDEEGMVYGVCRYGEMEIRCRDMRALWEKNQETVTSNTVVLNHHNPFADISITEQQFIYGSVMGQFERLGLSTSHTLTQVQKDTERSYMVLQPGFKIKKIRDVKSKVHQDVLFDDTLSTEITQNDTNVYVYVD